MKNIYLLLILLFSISNIKQIHAGSLSSYINTNVAVEVTVIEDLTLTKSTPKQTNADYPLRFIHQYVNTGNETISNITVEFKVKQNGPTIHTAEYTLPDIPAGKSINDTTYYIPTVIGSYTFQYFASHADLGDRFFRRALLNAFEWTESTLAKDDGGVDVFLGFAYGDPTWYGYYGSEFDLNQTDTLEQIAIRMISNETGTFNLTINVKDGLGLPNIELFHSDPIPIGAFTNDWIEYTLPEPLILSAGNYVFAVGQDTIQGLLGHGFDENRSNPGYWIISSVAGGGYPWFNINEPNAYNPTLMIRPVFKSADFVSSTSSELSEGAIKIYPNPLDELLQIEHSPSVTIKKVRLYSLDGKLHLDTSLYTTAIDIDHLAKGMYLVEVITEQGRTIRKVVKS